MLCAEFSILQYTKRCFVPRKPTLMIFFAPVQCEQQHMVRSQVQSIILMRRSSHDYVLAVVQPALQEPFGG